MSASERRMRLIALGCAVTALALALVAGGIAFHRGQRDVPSAVEDHRVSFNDVLKISGTNTEVVTERGVVRGARITDPELARALSLGPRDVVVAVSGVQIRDQLGPLLSTVYELAALHPTTLYVELERDHRPVLARWSVDLGLKADNLPLPARPHARPVLTAPALPDPSQPDPSQPDPSQPDPSQPDPLNDPAFDTIKRIDDTHYEMPRRTVDHLFAGSLSGVVRSIRIAPAVKNGVAVGFKLFAIRPGSAFAKLGFLNGDLVRGINGDALTTLDEALDIYVKARSADQFTIELERRGYPLFLHVVVR